MKLKAITFIAILALVFCFKGNAQTVKTKHASSDSLLLVANRLTITDPDKCITLLDSLMDLNKGVSNPLLYANIYNAYGCAYNSKSVYDKSFDYFFKGLEYTPQIKNSLISASINNNLGMLYDNFYLDNEALEYFEKAEIIYLENPELDKKKHYTLILLNIALVKNYQGKYDEALKYVKASQSYLNKSTNLKARYKEELTAITGIEMANVLMKLNKLDSAIICAKRNIDILEKSEQYFPLGNGYYYLANINFKMNDIETALKLVKKADSLEKIVGHKPLQRDIYNLFSEILAQKKELEISYDYYKKATKIDNELFSSKETWAFYRLRQDALRKEEQQQRALLEKEEELNDALMLLYAISASFLALIAGVFVYNQRNKHKKEKERIEQQKKVTKIELEKTKEVLELKKRELTSSALQIIQNGKTVQIFKKELESLKRDIGPKHKGRIASIANSLKFNSSKDWKMFKQRFEQVNTNFFKNIQSEYPNLTPNELKLCAFLKLSFNTKDIANLMGISSESVKVNRYKLRKKMSLDRNENLATHINKF